MERRGADLARDGEQAERLAEPGREQLLDRLGETAMACARRRAARARLGRTRHQRAQALVEERERRFFDGEVIDVASPHV